MSEAAETLDGWYSLHLFYAIDWTTFRLVPEDDRHAMVQELQQFLADKANARASHTGDQALYNITGQKADLLLWVLRPEMKELNIIENELNKCRISDFLIPTYSYVSVIELGNYLAGKSDEDPYENPHIKARLYPELPHSEYICFYQWINDEMKHIIGICYRWKIEKSSCTTTVKSVVNMLVKSNNLLLVQLALMILNGALHCSLMMYYSLKNRL